MNKPGKLSRDLGAIAALGLLGAMSTQAVAKQGAAPQATPPSPQTSETQPTPSPDPAAASSPHQRDVSKQEAEEAPPARNPDAADAATVHQRDALESKAGDTERAAGKDKQMAHETKPKDKLVGLPVESSDGTQLGSVVDIVRSTSGTPTYAVVAIDNDTTAVPYDTAVAMVRGDKVVMSQTRLASAPRVKQSEWLDETSSKWRTESDRYWGSTRTAEPGNMPKPKDR
jgi:hypothetical protein